MLVLTLGNPPAFAAAAVEVANFGSNPGNLRMFKYIPDQLPLSAPLVIVLHGCTQNARTFANQSGWIKLADRMHFALALPEQKQANNQNNCFDWFNAGDTTRDKGEALSIKQMVDKMKSDHEVDGKRIFVTGLSAGGAMTSVMLATYPDVFAGGGMSPACPKDAQKNLTDALQCMSTGHPWEVPSLDFPAVCCLAHPVAQWSTIALWSVCLCPQVYASSSLSFAHRLWITRSPF